MTSASVCTGTIAGSAPTGIAESAYSTSVLSRVCASSFGFARTFDIYVSSNNDAQASSEKQMKRKTKRRPRVNETALLRALTRKAYFQQKGKCYHCGDPITLPQATGDHYPIPRYRGGETRPGNIVAACVECNNHRNNETNRHGGRLDRTFGDDTPRSPFEVLKGLFHENANSSHK